MIRMPLFGVLAFAAIASPVQAEVPDTAITPDVVETSRGNFEFKC